MNSQIDNTKHFLYKIEKEELDEKIKIYLYYYDIKTYSITQITDEIPYQIILKTCDLESLNPKSNKIKITKNFAKNFENKKLTKIEISSKEIYKYLKNKAKELGFELYETDLSHENRYFIDKNLKIFDKKTYKQIKQKLNLKYLIFDIEAIKTQEIEKTKKKQKETKIDDLRIILISTYHNQNPEKNKVLITTEYLKESVEKTEKIIKNIKKTKKEYRIEIFKTEKELIEHFLQELKKYEPQIITGWNIINFDLNLLQKRCKTLKIPLKLTKYDKKEAKIRISKQFFKKSSFTTSGTIIYDSIDLLKDNFISVKDYKLNTVSKEILSDEKIDLENDNESLSLDEKEQIIQTYYNQDIGKLIEYNYKDSLLVHKILKKLNLIPLILSRSIITNTPLQKINSPINTLELIYLTKLHKRNIIAGNLKKIGNYEHIKGAFVLEPKKGFHENIFVFDFKSIYPTVIVTFNIDPYTYNPEKGEILAPNGAKFIKEKGILPQIIEEILLERAKAKKEKDKIKSFALKTTLASFYGAISSPKSRFYNKQIGDAITSFSRKIIKKSINYIEKEKHEVIYSDTDSLFVKFKKKFKNLEEKKEFGQKYVQKINEYLSNWIEKEYNLRSYLELEFEKIFSKFFIFTKKRYVGYEELTKKITFVGLEVVRGDWTELAKEFQKSLVEKIFSGAKKEELEEFIKKYIKKLKKGEFDKKLIYTKKIMKPLNEYIKTTPPHVKAAREIPNFEGKIVKYVITNKGPKHITLIKKFKELKLKYDYEHYIEKQLKSVASDFLNYYKIDFEQLTQKNKQNNLQKFIK